MAKFALVGYGSDGRGVGTTNGGYTYVVNNSVRTGDILQPVVTHANKKTVFVTTGKANHVYQTTSIKGLDAKQQAESSGEKIKDAYTGKEVGASGERAYKLQENVPKGIKPEQSQYENTARAGNIQKYLEQNPNVGQYSSDAQVKLSKNAQETFDSYSSKFTK